jgi:hypothetical protein
MTTRLLESAALRGTEGTSSRALEGTGTGAGLTYVKYRTFNGTGDNLTFNAAETVGQRMWNPGTAVICLRRTRDSAGGPGGGYQEWFSGVNSAVTSYTAVYFDPTDLLDIFDFDSGGIAGGPSIKTADGWAVCVISRGATNGIRAHSYKYTEGTWHHDGMSGSNLNVLLDAGSYFEVSQQGGYNQWLAADVAAIAYWHRELSDTQIGTLHSSLAAWSALSPDHLWRMDGSPISDSVGTSTIRTISGTTLTTNDSALPET